MGSSALITSSTPITTVPAQVSKKKSTKASAVKKEKPLTVSESSSSSVSIKIPCSKAKNVDSSVDVKKLHTMASLYVDPLNPKPVEPNVNTSAKGSIILNVESSEKLVLETHVIDKPKYDEILG
jgi:hypothetical protein